MIILLYYFRAFSVHSLSCDYIDEHVEEGDQNEGKIIGAPKLEKNTFHSVPVVKGKLFRKLM